MLDAIRWSLVRLTNRLPATEIRAVSAALRQDRRAIEGLPIRLVIALVVGVASLSLMLNMLSGLPMLGISELDTRPAPTVVEPGEQTLTITVVGSDGSPVADATVIVKGGSADIDGVRTARTGPNGNVTVSITPTLRPNQDEGTLTTEVKPPAGSQYADRRKNTAVLVVRQ